MATFRKGLYGTGSWVTDPQDQADESNRNFSANQWTQGYNAAAAGGGGLGRAEQLALAQLQQRDAANAQERDDRLAGQGMEFAYKKATLDRMDTPEKAYGRNLEMAKTERGWRKEDTAETDAKSEKRMQALLAALGGPGANAGLAALVAAGGDPSSAMPFVSQEIGARKEEVQSRAEKAGRLLSSPVRADRKEGERLLSLVEASDPRASSAVKTSMAGTEPVPFSIAGSKERWGNKAENEVKKAAFDISKKLKELPSSTAGSWFSKADPEHFGTMAIMAAKDIALRFGLDEQEVLDAIASEAEKQSEYTGGGFVGDVLTGPLSLAGMGVEALGGPSANLKRLAMESLRNSARR